MKRKTALFFEGALFVAIAWGVVYFISPAESGNLAESPRASLNPQREKSFVTMHNAEKAYPGFTLIPATGKAKVLLVSMTGEVVHSWPVDATRARLLPNGNLLVVHGSKWGLKTEPWKTLRKHIREYDWNGNIVWEYISSGLAHHDVQRLPNGNTIFPVREFVPKEFKEAIQDQRRRTAKIRSDAFLEVTPAGEVVWRWHAHEHLDLNSCGKRKCNSFAGMGEAEKRMTDWTHINTVSLIPENKWFDKGDSRFRPGNIITIPRNWWTVLIVDRETGDIVWEYTGDYRGGLSGGHEAHMIPKGLRGAGNIMVFDNGRLSHQGESFLLELNPVTKERQWTYDVGKKFFSRSAGSAMRLPNGNTFISEDVNMRAFEITQEEEIVWEYKAPFMLSRARRYPADYCKQFDLLLKKKEGRHPAVMRESPQ